MPRKTGARQYSKLRRRWKVFGRSTQEITSSLYELRQILDILLREEELMDYEREDIAHSIAEMSDPRLDILDLVRNFGAEDLHTARIDHQIEELAAKRADWVRIYAIADKPEELVSLLSSDDNDICIQSAKYLAVLGSSVIPIIESAIKDKDHPFLRYGERLKLLPFFLAATTAVCDMVFNDDPPELLMNLASDSFEEVRKLAVNRLIEFESEKVINLFDEIYRDESNYDIRKLMAHYLWEHDRVHCVEFLLDEDPDRIVAPTTAAQEEYLIGLAAYHSSENEELMLRAGAALELLSFSRMTPEGESKFNKLLIEMFLYGVGLNDKAYSEIKRLGILPDVLSLLKSDDKNMCLNVLDALETVVGTEALPEVTKLKKHPDKEIAERAKEVYAILKKNNNQF